MKLTSITSRNLQRKRATAVIRQLVDARSQDLGCDLLLHAARQFEDDDVAAARATLERYELVTSPIPSHHVALLQCVRDEMKSRPRFEWVPKWLAPVLSVGAKLALLIWTKDHTQNYFSGDTSRPRFSSRDRSGSPRKVIEGGAPVISSTSGREEERSNTAYVGASETTQAGAAVALRKGARSDPSSRVVVWRTWDVSSCGGKRACRSTSRGDDGPRGLLPINTRAASLGRIAPRRVAGGHRPTHRPAMYTSAGVAAGRTD